VAGCGGDDDDPQLSSTPPPTATQVPIDTETEEPTDDGSGGDDAAGTDTDNPGAADGTADDGDADAAADGSADATPPGGGEAVPTPTQAPISGEPAFTADSKLSTVGLDEVFFGDPVDVAAEQADTEWVGLPPAGSVPQCYTVQPAGGPAGIVFTVFDGRIERVDITNPSITTRSGASVGSTQAGLFDLFGDRLEETEFDDGADIMFVPADADDREFRIIWRTDGVAATSMRAGRVPVVLPSAPCG